jgi:hypothetical protein
MAARPGWGTVKDAQEKRPKGKVARKERRVVRQCPAAICLHLNQAAGCKGLGMKWCRSRNDLKTAAGCSTCQRRCGQRRPAAVAALTRVAARPKAGSGASPAAARTWGSVADGLPAFGESEGSLFCRPPLGAAAEEG